MTLASLHARCRRAYFWGQIGRLTRFNEAFITSGRSKAVVWFGLFRLFSVLVDLIMVGYLAECEVLHPMIRNLSNREIAQMPCISPNSAETHVEWLYEKMGVTNNIKAAEKARQLKML